MPFTARQVALTAINEAITALDQDIVGPLETDELTDLALESLMSARELLTPKPWPEDLALRDAAAFEAWVAARMAEQLKDGRQ